MTNKKAFSILLAVAVIITLFEILNLTKISLWHDESFSALLVKYNFPEMIERIKMDVHPPLYYIFLRGWNDTLGNSLFSIRMFSVFFSFLAILSVYLFTNYAFKNRNLSLFSSLLYALSYFQIQYAMEARMYSLGTFLVVISTYFFLKAIETKKIKWWLLYTVFASLGIYTHYFAAFWILSQAIYLIFLFWREFKFKISNWFKDRNLKLALISYFLLLVSYIPWIPTFLKQLNQVQEDYWIEKMNIWSIPNTFFKMTTGGTIDPNRAWYILVFLIAIIALAIFLFIKKTQLKEKWLIFSLLIVPFLMTAVLSLNRPIYIDRYFIFGFPFYLILIASAILSINAKMVRRILIGIALLGVSLTFPLHWTNLKVEQKPGMAAAAEYINRNAKPGEKIFVGSSLIYFTFKYYNQTEIYSKLYAPGSMPHYSGTALLSREDIIADFNEETKTDDIVWMINTTGFGNYQPAVPDHWSKIKEKDFEEIKNYQGWIIVAKYEVK